MKLSPNFTLAELKQTGTGIRNDPPPSVLKRLAIVAWQMEHVRRICDSKPVLISSGYRCSVVNEKVGGSANSAHIQGWAVDFTVPGYGDPYEVCAAIERSGLPFDQLINERGRWVHISFDPVSRSQMLTQFKAGEAYHSGLHRAGE